MKKNGLSKKEKIRKKRWLRKGAFVRLYIDFYIKEEEYDDIGNIIRSFHIFTEQRPFDVSHASYGEDGLGNIISMSIQDEDFYVILTKISDEECSMEHMHYRFGLLKSKHLEKYEFNLKKDSEGDVIKDQEYCDKWLKAKDHINEYVTECANKYIADGYNMYVPPIQFTGVYDMASDKWKDKYMLNYKLKEYNMYFV